MGCQGGCICGVVVVGVCCCVCWCLDFDGEGLGWFQGYWVCYLGYFETELECV